MDYSTLSETLLVARAKHKQTQAQAAEANSVSARTWKSWESEGARPRADSLQALSKYTGLSLRDLIRLIHPEREVSGAHTVLPVTTGAPL